MFFIPLNTDAPIYHWPFVTVVLIGLNVLIFGLASAGMLDQADWVLQFGRGLHPLEWITCNFWHFGIFHLIGNMIFLWGFGLVVEGKIGWWKYLLVYLLIGVLHSIVEQLMMLGYQGGVAGGASGVIFGLLAIALVWAPKNEVSCLFVFFFFYIRIATFEVTIMTFSMIYLALEIFLVTLRVLAAGDIAVSSEVIHLLGAIFGFAIGALMVKKEWVDCENWDLFAVMQGTYGGGLISSTQSWDTSDNPAPGTYNVQSNVKGIESATNDVDLAASRAEKRRKSLRRMREFLKAGKPNAALTEYEKIRNLVSDTQLGERDLAAFANAFYKSKSWKNAVDFLEEYLGRFPDDAEMFRLKLANILIVIQERPRYALRVLAPISVEDMPEEITAPLAELKRRAQKQIDDGVIELEGQAWS